MFCHIHICIICNLPETVVHKIFSNPTNWWNLSYVTLWRKNIKTETCYHNLSNLHHGVISTNWGRMLLQMWIMVPLFLECRNKSSSFKNISTVQLLFGHAKTKNKKAKTTMCNKNKNIFMCVFETLTRWNKVIILAPHPREEESIK